MWGRAVRNSTCTWEWTSFLPALCAFYHGFSPRQPTWDQRGVFGRMGASQLKYSVFGKTLTWHPIFSILSTLIFIKRWVFLLWKSVLWLFIVHEEWLLVLNVSYFPVIFFPWEDLLARQYFPVTLVTCNHLPTRICLINSTFLLKTQLEIIFSFLA